MDKQTEDKNQNDRQEKFSKEIIDLVIARLKTIPPDASLSIGGEQDGLTTEDLIERVRSGDEMGRKIIEAQLYFLRSLQDLPIEDHVSINN